MRMTVGEIVDYCIEYNDIHGGKDEKETEKPKTRKATQSDWDAFWG